MQSSGVQVGHQDSINFTSGNISLWAPLFIQAVHNAAWALTSNGTLGTLLDPTEQLELLSFDEGDGTAEAHLEMLLGNVHAQKRFQKRARISKDSQENFAKRI